MRIFRSLFVPTIVALLAVCSFEANAAVSDVPSEIASCADWQNAKERDLLEACSRHTGCGLMLKARNSCPAAKEFIGKLEKTLAGRNEITNEVVFYAAMPKLTQSKAMESKINATKQILEAGRNGPAEGTRIYKDNSGEITYYYEGGLKDGQRHGVGILIGRSSGTARFGQFSSNTHVGQGWVYDSDGLIFVGDFVNNSPRGNIAFQNTNGVALVGNFDGAKWAGVIDFTGSSGHYKHVHDNDGKYIASYPASVPDGALLLLVQKNQQNPPPQQPGSSNPQPSTPAPSGTGTVESKADLEKLAKNLTSRKESTYPSVCKRNWDKIFDIFRSRELYNGAATYDLFMQDIHSYMAKLFEPCKNTDEDSASAYAKAMGNFNDVREHCAGPHDEWECTQWGANGGKSYNQGNPYDNYEYTRVWKEEVGKAISDPNYSAEYGPIRWAGKSSPADIACWKSLGEITKQYDAEKKNIPENSIVVLSEATMWKIAKSTELISAKCPNSSEYMPEISRMKHVYEGLQRACDATSTSPPCVPRLPGKPSVSPPVPVANTLPPLKGKSLEVACGLPPSPNAIKCLEEKCDKQEGKLSLDKDSCAHCNTKNIGNYWFVCPTGVGGAR